MTNGAYGEIEVISLSKTQARAGETITVNFRAKIYSWASYCVGRATIWSTCAKLTGGKTAYVEIPTAETWYSGSVPFEIPANAPVGTYGIYCFGVTYKGTNLKPANTVALDIVSDAPPEYFNLTTAVSPADGGTISQSVAGTRFLKGTTLSICACAAGAVLCMKETPTWKFNYWSGDASGTNQCVSITMDRDKSVVANFVRKEPQFVCPICGAKFYSETDLNNHKASEHPTVPGKVSTAISIQTMDIGGVSGIREIRVGQPLIISSRLTRTDTGTGIVNKPVGFRINGVNVGGQNTNSQAVAQTYQWFTQAGDFEIWSLFPGDAEFNPCESEHIWVKVLGGWSEAQKAKMREIGLSDAEFVSVPANTTDIIAVGFEVPRIRRWNKGDLESEARAEVDKVLQEKEPGATVLNAYARSRGTGWFDWTEGWDCFVFICSPLEPTTVALAVLALKVAIVALIAVAIIWWRWVDIRIAETRQEEVENINDLIESIRNDPDLTPEQKDAYINKLLGLWENAGASSEGWLDWLKNNWKLIALGVGALIIVPFILPYIFPKKKEEK